MITSGARLINAVWSNIAEIVVQSANKPRVGNAAKLIWRNAGQW